NAQHDPYFRPTSRPGWMCREIARLVVVGFNTPIQTPGPGGYTFQDVLPGAPEFVYIETIAAHNIDPGYPCGGPGEPCGQFNRPYFRPTASDPRGRFA